MNPVIAFRTRFVRGDFARNVLTIAVGTGLSQGIIILTAPIMTRIYSPVDYGLYAVASSVMGILISITCLRFEYVIPLPADDQAAANGLALSMIANVVVTVVAFIVLVVFQAQILGAMGGTALGGALLLISFGQLAGGGREALTNWAIRTKDFAAIAQMRVQQSVVMVAVQVGLGLLGMNHVGLLIGAVLSRVTGSSRLFRSAMATNAAQLRNVSWRGVAAMARRYRRFAALSTPAALLNALGLQLPTLVLVALYGPQTGGLFALADRICSAPLQLVAGAVGNVFLAEASRSARTERRAIRGLFLRTTWQLVRLGVLPTIALAVVAPIAAGIVLGPQWQLTGVFVAILAPMYFMTFLATATGDALYALERMDLQLLRETIRVLGLGGSVVVASAVGLSATGAIVALSVGGTITYLLYTVITWWAINHSPLPQHAPTDSPVPVPLELEMDGERPLPPEIDGRATADLEAGREPADFEPAEVGAGSARAATRSPLGDLAASPVEAAVPVVLEIDRQSRSLSPDPTIDPATRAVRAAVVTAVRTPAAGRLGPTSDPVLRLVTPSGWTPERAYAARQVLGEWLGLAYELHQDDGRLVRLERMDKPGLPVVTMPDAVFSAPDGEWGTWRSRLTGPSPRLVVPSGRHTDGERVPDPAPVPHPVPSGDGLAWTVADGTVALRADVLGSVFAMLARVEEVGPGPRDSHDRFPSEATWAAAEDVVERPVADDLVDMLWLAMRAAWPDVRRRAETYELVLTHDVDQPWSALGRPAWRVLRSIGADVVLRRDGALAARRMRAAYDATRGRVDRDPVGSFDFLAATSERHGLRSTFFFQAGTMPTDQDFRYRLSDPVFDPVLRDLHARGHAIGLHGSYISHGNAAQLAREADALREVCRTTGVDQSVLNSRQHYLRFRNPDTWRNLAAAGVTHDSTVGFAERPGYRSGTCREHAVFDLAERRTLDLRERPLAVMDATLLGYQGLDWPAAVEAAIRVGNEARRRAGMAVLVVHNDTVASDWARGHYRELVEALAP